MADPSQQNSAFASNPQSLPTQARPDNEHFNPQHVSTAQQQNNGFQTQDGVSTMQINTPPGQPNTQSQPSHFTNSHPAPTLQVQDPTTIHPHPSDAGSLSNSATYGDEKREVSMPATRGHTAAVTANSATNSNNIAASILPQIRPGGAPARVYLNEKVVPYLLDGMKGLAKDQPNDPLRVLGEYLLQKSKEVGENADDQMSG